MRVIYSIILSLAFIGVCFAQWTNVAPNLLGTIPFNNNGWFGGVIKYKDGVLWACYNNIWVSADLGKTWSLRTPKNLGYIPNIMDIALYDKFNAVVSTGQGTILITSDQGLSWEEQTIINSYNNSLYSIAYGRDPDNIIIAKYPLAGNTVIVTADRGIVWDSISFGKYSTALSVVSDSNDRVFAAGSINVYVSYDYGITWKKLPGEFDWDSWSMVADPCDSMSLYVVNEQLGTPYDDLACIYNSADLGTTWKANNIQPIPYHCGSIAIGEYGIFVQTFSGIERSTDKGLTWKRIGGPPNYGDTRFITAVDDNIIFAVDKFGSVWKTTNSGGDPLKPGGYLALDKQMLFESDTLTTCDSSVIQTVRVEKFGCNPPSVEQIWITGIDSVSYTLSPEFDTIKVEFTPHHIGQHTGDLFVRTSDGTVFKIALRGFSKQPPLEFLFSPPVLSDTLEYCDLDSINFTLRVKGCGAPFQVTGTSIDPIFEINSKQLPVSIEESDTLTLSLAFTSRQEPGLYQDSLILSGFYIIGSDTIPVVVPYRVSVRILPSPPQLSASASDIDFGSINTCGLPVDTTIPLSNHGCDTLKITQGPGILPPEFQLLNPLSLPYDLPPDSSVALRFRFFPSAVGSFSCKPRFRAEQQGLAQDIEFEIAGRGEPGAGFLDYRPISFDFNALSICGRDSGSGFITNKGCDTLTFDSFSFTGDADFTTAGIPSIELAAGDTVRYTVYVNPVEKGNRTGYIILTSTNGNGPRRDSIPLVVKVVDGTRILSSSVASIDFGTISPCDEHDSVITLENRGCDTLVIGSIGVTGNGYRVTSNVPIILLPGESRDIEIMTQADTSGGQTTNTATIDFVSNADNQLAPVRLWRTLTAEPKRSYDVHLTMSSDIGTSADVVTLALEAGDWWKQDPVMSGVTRLDFDLVMNNDLLHYLQWGGPNNVTVNGSHVTISGNPVTASNGVLADFTYMVHLTKDSVTDIVLSNLVLNNGAEVPCDEKTVTGTGSSFMYQYRCGEKTIQRLLRNERLLAIMSVKPNPARDEVRIEYVARTGEPAMLEIFDMLGRKVWQSSPQSAGGGVNAQSVVTRAVLVPVEGMPSGSYVARIVQGREVISKRFAVER